jgi:putative peptidoglycan lipid II flippase
MTRDLLPIIDFSQKRGLRHFYYATAISIRSAMNRAYLIAALVTINMFISFFFQWFLFTKVGPTLETDAVVAGLAVPQLLLNIVLGSIVHTLVPLFTNESSDNFLNTVSMLFKTVLLYTASLILVLTLSSNFWVHLITPGFNSQARGLALEILIITLIGSVFAISNSVLISANYAKNEYLRTETINIICNAVCLTILITFLQVGGIIIVGLAFLSRYLLQTIMLTLTNKIHFFVTIDNEKIKLYWKRLKPLILGSSYYKTDLLIERALLTSSGSGVLSIFFLAQQIYGAASEIIARSVINPRLQELSKLFCEKDLNKFIALYKSLLLEIVLISIAVCLFLGLYGRPVLNLLIGYGNMTADNINDLFYMMLWFIGVFCLGLLSNVTTTVFYAGGDTRTPTYLSVVTFTLYVPFKIVMFFKYDVYGVAIAGTVLIGVNLLLQFIYLRRLASGIVRT